MIGVSTDDLEPNGLIAVEGRRIIVEYAECYLLCPKFILRFLNGPLQHLFAIAFASQLVINDDESETDNGLRRVRIAEHDMSNDFPFTVDGGKGEDNA